MTIQKSTATHQGVAVECAKITADKPCTWRFSKTLNFSGSYAWQFVIKADEDTQVDVTVGNQTETFDVSTEFELLSHVFENVEADNYPYVEIKFPIGEFYVYHTQLEHGDESSEWNPNNGGVEQDVYDLQKEVKALEGSLGTLATKNAVSVSTESSLGNLDSDYVSYGNVGTVGVVNNVVTLQPGLYLLIVNAYASGYSDYLDRISARAYSDDMTISDVAQAEAVMMNPPMVTPTNFKRGRVNFSAVVDVQSTAVIKVEIAVSSATDPNTTDTVWGQLDFQVLPLNITSTNTISYS